MEFFDTLEWDGGMGLGLLFISLIGLAGNWRLFVKCNQPGWAVIVPGYNVVVAMRIVGRPASHALYFLIPVFNLYFFFKTILELANTFGKDSTLDYVLACVFNVFYILNLGLSEEEDYLGPVFGEARREVNNATHMAWRRDAPEPSFLTAKKAPRRAPFLCAVRCFGQPATLAKAASMAACRPSAFLPPAVAKKA